MFWAFVWCLESFWIEIHSFGWAVFDNGRRQHSLPANSKFTPSRKVKNVKSSIWLKIAAALLACNLGHSGAQVTAQAMLAPDSLAGWDVVLQIEKNTSAVAGSPVKGVVVKRFAPDGTYTAEGTATMSNTEPAYKQSSRGTYHFERKSSREAVERWDVGSAPKNPRIALYTFDTPTSGSWSEDWGNGAPVVSGKFTLVRADLSAGEHLAPQSIAGRSVALIIKKAESSLPPNSYPGAGLVLQTYATNGTLKFQGFGPGTLNSQGTYTYTKVAPHTAVEEVTQVSKDFTLPYTMVYNYKTATSGTWFQNFGNGLILFSGTFDIFSD